MRKNPTSFAAWPPRPRAGSFVLAAAMFALAPTSQAADADSAPVEMILPIPDAARGRELYVVKGCVVCHSVNGVGGTAGPSLDARADAGPVDPLDFAARMWTGAQAMADLQATEFGYQIELTGQQIADLAAFESDADEQSKLSETDVPELMRGWVLDDF